MWLVVAAESSADATWVSPVIAGVVALAVAVLTNIVGFRMQRDRLRQELKTEFMAEQAIVQLLQHSKWSQRSFMVIRSHIGGFEDDELRRLLVRAGAVRFVNKNDATEWWGLRERNKNLIE